MLAATHAEVCRYDREERARDILRGSRLVLVDPREHDSEVYDTLTWASADVRRFTSLDRGLRELCGSARPDALVLDAAVSEQGSTAHLRRADPSLASFVIGGGPKVAARLRGRLAGLEHAPILDRPAARFEILEFAASAVEQTRSIRRGRPNPSANLVTGPPAAGLEKPRPDLWSCAVLRARICYWSRRVGLSERETEVMRGVVRRLKNKEIAAQLDLSVHAVKKYLRELLQKLELESRHEVAWLLERTPDSAVG